MFRFIKEMNNHFLETQYLHTDSTGNALAVIEIITDNDYTFQVLLACLQLVSGVYSYKYVIITRFNHNHSETCHGYIWQLE